LIKYEDENLQVHADKNRVTPCAFGSTDFLRVQYCTTLNIAKGFPSRMCSSMIFNKPWNVDKQPGNPEQDYIQNDHYNTWLQY